MDGINGEDGEQGPPGLPGEKGDSGPQGPVSAGVVYTHWGKDSCGNIMARRKCPKLESSVEVVYSGIVVGEHTNYYGGGNNYLCLPEEKPEYLNKTFKSNYANLYGTEYESPILPQDLNVPCAVCYTSTKSVQVMIPAKTTCPRSWNEEYVGYLMTARYSHKSNKDYICVDKDGIGIPGSRLSISGAQLHHVSTTCTGIPCPPYETKLYVACVVCTK